MLARALLAAALVAAVSAGGLYLLRDRLIQAFARPILEQLRHPPPHEAGNIERARLLKAAQEAADYVDRFMPLTKSFPSERELLAFSLQHVDQRMGGLYAEFGVYTGGSINFIADHIHGEVHGFDSFEGLPEDWRDGLGKGTFKLAKPPDVRPNVRLHKGWFHESLPLFKQQFPQPMAFLHLDADLYSSTKTVLDLLADRIRPGTVLVFDEFFNYPAWQQGEYKAFAEFVRDQGVDVEYLAYNRYGEQVAVKVRQIRGRAAR